MPARGPIEVVVTTTEPSHTELPGELATFRAVGAVAFWLGVVGGLMLWLTQPETIRNEFIAILTTLACVAMGTAMLAVPWNRIGQQWLVVAPLVGTVVIAAGIANMDGGREVYEGFYLYAALSACYFLPGRQVRLVLVVVAAAAALPLLENASADSVVRWAYVATGAAMLATVLQSARARVREYAAEVHALALRDQLTGVLNRRGLEARAGEEIARARRHGDTFALVYLDLDGFKQVNDNLSHATGDRVLERAAVGMEAVLRGEGALARVGGDEFVALLPASRPADGAAVAARMVDAIEAVAAGVPGAGHVSATTAWSSFPHDGDTLDALMREADAVLLERKRARPSARWRA
jgi:diguanylate cyclase (GGDEF)-like protein